MLYRRSEGSTTISYTKLVVPLGSTLNKPVWPSLAIVPLVCRITMAAIMYALPDLGQYCRPGLLFLASWAVFIIYRTLLVERDPNTLPYFDRPPGKTGFSLRTYYRYYTDCGGLMREAYEKVNSQNLP